MRPKTLFSNLHKIKVAQEKNEESDNNCLAV